MVRVNGTELGFDSGIGVKDNEWSMVMSEGKWALIEGY